MHVLGLCVLVVSDINIFKSFAQPLYLGKILLPTVTQMCFSKAFPWVLCFGLFTSQTKAWPWLTSIQGRWVGSKLGSHLPSGAGRAESDGLGLGLLTRAGLADSTLVTVGPLEPLL